MTDGQSNAKSQPMRIVYAASEMAPYAKTGGLADVIASLPAALAERGADIHTVLPLYRSVREEGVLSGAQQRSFSVLFRGEQHESRIHTIRLAQNNAVSFVERDEFFDRAQLYGPGGQGYLDNADRFIFFNRAVLSLCAQKQFSPQIIHCNDWQTGLIPVYLKNSPGKSMPAPPLSVLTIHNLAYQGNFPAETMGIAGLPLELYTPQRMEFYGKMSFLKGGIIYADSLTTVSPTYAKEICTPEFGHGMDGVLRTRKKDMIGILNGVDYSIWDPASDTHIAAPFNARDVRGKAVCRDELLNIFGLDASPKVPVVGMVSRLAEQKGFDIVLEALPALMDLDIRMVVLGTGEPRIEKQLKILSRVYGKKMKVKTAYDNALAHKIEAGSDMFLMPSRYEPCGLNQMYSLRYGTIPIVRATGGLEDSVEAFSTRTGEGTGFKFKEYTAASLVRCVKKAADLYKNSGGWKTLMGNAMGMDFSWSRSAGAYLDLYEGMLRKV